MPSSAPWSCLFQVLNGFPSRECPPSSYASFFSPQLKTDRLPNLNTGSHFGGQRSTRQPGICGGVSCTMPFHVQLSDVNDGRQKTLRPAQTAKPPRKTSCTTWSCALRNAKLRKTFFPTTQTGSLGLTNNWNNSFVQIALHSMA